MNRRAFLKLLGLSAAATALAPLAPALGPAPLKFADELDALLAKLDQEYFSYRLDWPLGFVTFNGRSMLRLTSIVSV
jgi:hypothetical protein